MSEQWADFPDGQVGLYGSDASKMLNGTPWLYIGNTALGTDPDTTLADRGIVCSPNTLGSTMTTALRMALDAPHQKAGASFNLWPVSIVEARPILYFGSTSNTPRFTLGVTANGGLQLRTTSGTVLATADYPLVRVNSWQHIEMNADAVTGAVEVRVRGNAVPELTGTFTPPGSTIGIVALPTRYDAQAGESNYRYKNFVAYNGAGSRFNSFLGNAAVNDLYPNSDLDLKWAPSSGSLGYPLIKDNTPGNRLTLTGTVSAGENITIASVRYQWTAGSVDAGTPSGTTANPWLVALGGTTEESLENLWNAINATGTPGTTYSTALTAHPTLKAVGYSPTLLEIEPQDGITTGQTCAESIANGSWASSSTFWYGPSDTTYLEADYTPAVAATGSFTVSGGVPIADETFAIGANTWTFKASRVNPFEVPIGGDAAATALNMITYINVDQTVGVEAASGGSGVVDIEASTGGVAGDSITLSETATNVTKSGDNLTGGVDPVYPDPDIVGFTNLPADVTSVKGLMALYRAAKTDGGDGKMQVSLSPNGTDWDDGTDRALTTAQSYYWDTSEVSPDTSGPWTVSEVNALQGKLNRTQ